MAQQDEERGRGTAVTDIEERDPRDDESLAENYEPTGLGLGLGPQEVVRDEDVPGTDGWRPVEERASGASGGHGDSLSYGGTRGYSRYGETTGLVGYDVGEGKDPQEMNTPPSDPRPGKPTETHQESGPETSRVEGSHGQHRGGDRG